MPELNFYFDALGEAVRNAIDTNLGATWGLVTVEQGDYLTIPPEADLPGMLPLVFVEFSGGTHVKDRGKSMVSSTLRYTVHYVDIIEDDEEPGREVPPFLAAVAKLFSQPPFFDIPGYTKPAGLTISSACVTATEKLDDLADEETPLAHGTATLEIVADSFAI